jgi:methionine-rich copper-binding protein CopC
MANAGLAVTPQYFLNHLTRVATDRTSAPWPHIGMIMIMRGLRLGWLAALIIAALMIGALPLRTSSAETVSTGIVTAHPKANDVVDGSMVQISLGFEAPVDHERSMLLLKTSRGDRQLKPRLESAPNYLFGIAGHLAPGAYELDWTARFSDGRSSGGAIPFIVESKQAAGELG